MKYFRLLLLLCVVSSCCRNVSSEKLSFTVFSPDTLLTVEDIIKMGVEREHGVDNDIYVLKNEDTTIWVEFEVATGSLLGYSWIIPISETTNEKTYVESLKEKYGISYDMINKTITNPQNGLLFKYYIGKIDTTAFYGDISSDYCCIIWYHSRKKTAHDTKFQLLPKESCDRIEDLSEFKFFKPFKDDIYILAFQEDTLSLLWGSDSVGKIDIDSNRFVLFYNSELLKETGFVIWGDKRNRTVHILQTGRQYYMECFKSTDKILLRIVEDIADLLNPPLYKVIYVLPSFDYEASNTIKILSSSFVLLGESGVEISDSLVSNQIVVKGNYDDMQIDDVIKIKEDFELPECLDSCYWCEIKLFEKKVSSHIYHY